MKTLAIGLFTAAGVAMLVAFTLGYVAIFNDVPPPDQPFGRDPLYDAAVLTFFLAGLLAAVAVWTGLEYRDKERRRELEARNDAQR